MKRKLFFFLEKLEIKRSERIAIVILFACLVAVSGFYVFFEPQAVYDSEAYAELEKTFEERSRVQQQEEDIILARYEPEADETNSDFMTAPADTVPPDSAEKKETAGSDVININEATAERLTELPGIGPAYAERIVEWREENGSFTSKDQLLEIRGIGEKRLENILPMIEL